MRLLLDTHVALWALADAPKLGPSARAAIVDAGNDVLVSAVSVAEVAIKASSGKLTGAEHFVGECRTAGLAELPFTAAHADALRELPLLHRNPFDRLLVCQARVEGLTVVTVDPQCREYAVATLDGGQ